MAMSSFSLSRGLRSWHSTLALWMMIAIPLVSCENLKTRSETSGANRGSQLPTPAAGTTGPTASAGSGQPVPAIPVPPTPPQPQVPPPPTFLNKELPKVGLILGPGGMKSYAHLGVLRELNRARVPIHAVAGLEWGAVMGALFASQGQVNDAEWKAMKLKESDLPGEGGFLSARWKPQSIASLTDFLETVFNSVTIERSKIDFGCPAYWSRVDRFGWMTKGPIKEAMRACLPYPPFYTDNAGVLASPFAVDEAAAFLRTKGANLIVLVNVLGQGETLPAKMDDPSGQILWSEIRREMLRAKSPNVHFSIHVNTTGHPVTDFAGRRALVEAGTRSATEVINKMVSQYGF